MEIAPVPENEQERLEELLGYKILDTPQEKTFDDLTRLAAYICGTPISLITLLDSDRQWFKSKQGLEMPETPRDIAFCSHAITEPDQILVVNDATQDPRFVNNPLVTSDTNIRFYAGVPLVTPNNHALGTLCVLDTQPRQLSQEQLDALQILADHAIHYFELRRNLESLTLVQTKKRQTFKQRRGFFKKIVVGLGLASAMLLAMGAITYRSTLESIQTEQMVRHTFVVLNDIEELFAHLQEAETTERGYVITGEQQYLEDYAQATRNIDSLLDELQTLTVDNISQQERLNKLEPLIERKIAFMESVIELRRNQGFEAASSAITTNENETLTNNIQVLVEAMRTEENLLLKARSTASQRSARNTLISLAIAVVITVIILIVVYYLIAREIREREVTQDALTQERNFISAVVETTAALVAVIDPQGNIVRFNRACSELTGYSFLEVRDRLFWDLLLPPEDREKVRASFNRIQRGNFPENVQNRWLTREGKRRLIAWTNTALLSQEGDVEFIIKTGVDITERKRREKHLKAEQAATQVLATATTIEEAMPKLLGAIAQSLEWERGELWTPKEPDQGLRCTQIWQRTGTTEEMVLAELTAVTKQGVIASEYGVWGQVWQNRQSVWVEDLVQAENCTEPELLAQVGLHAAFSIPLVVGEELLGMMVFYKDEVQERDSDLLRVMEAVGNQIGQFIKRKQAEAEVQKQVEILQNELKQAAAYVHSLLPDPLNQRVQIEQKFVPSLQLGGDVFDYFWLDSEHLVIYLLDVAGHGVKPALLSVSVLNILRSQSLAHTDFSQPHEVLEGLNRVFQMSESGDDYFTIWYGVYNSVTNELVYAAAGHPPAILLSQNLESDDLTVQQLQQKNLPIGMFPDWDYEEATAQVPDQSMLYIFSDGVYEIPLANGEIMGVDAFIDLLVNGQKLDQDDLDSIYQQIQKINQNDTLDDDFSLLKIAIKE